MRAHVTLAVAVFVGTLLAPSVAAGPACIAGSNALEGTFALDLGGGVAVPLGLLGDEVTLNSGTGATGLDFHRGWVTRVGADFYMTSFASAGLWVGDAELAMRDQTSIAPNANSIPFDDPLVRGSATMVGLRFRAYLPTPGPWSPYAAVGVTHFHRRAELSHTLPPLDPTNPIYRITDDRVGYDLGAGFEYRLAKRVGWGIEATYWDSGPFQHEFPWLAHERPLANWSFWTVDAHLVFHLPALVTR